MASTAALQGKIKVCMFDQYGTVVDMQDWTDKGRHTISQTQRMGGQSVGICNLVTSDAFRKLDDRCPAAEGTHPVPGDRSPVRRMGLGARRDPIHYG